MKKIFYLLAVVSAAAFVSSDAAAQYHPRVNRGYYHQPAAQSFYYYPQSNLYFNPATNQYVYFYRNSWVVSRRLPHRYRIQHEPRVVVVHTGFDVWNDNRYHVAKYRNQRPMPPVVVYDRAHDGRGW